MFRKSFLKRMGISENTHTRTVHKDGSGESYKPIPEKNMKYDIKRGSEEFREKMKHAYSEGGMKHPKKFESSKTKALEKMKKTK